MKKILSLSLAVIMAILLFGCGSSKGDPHDDKQVNADRQTTDRQSDSLSDENSSEDENSNEIDITFEQEEYNADADMNLTVSESYTVFTDAKNILVEKIMAAFSSDPELSLLTLDLTGVVMVDLLMIPTAVFGMGEGAAKDILAMLQLTDVEYKESGNKYSVKYKDNEGKDYKFEGEYDEKAESLTCAATKDGNVILNAEYYRTSFGYVAQYHHINDNGEISTFKISIQGDAEGGVEGIIGISDDDKFTSLTGNEKIDFPKECKAWYAIFNNEVTGVTKDGKKINIEYTP